VCRFLMRLDCRTV